jgi:DEAD/DEAH box helicase domain-containing protein
VVTLPPREAVLAEWPGALRPEVRQLLSVAGFERAYSHQAAAVEASLAGQDVCLVTGTSSGKTLAFLAPLIEALLGEPNARALLVYPTKALAQDQEARIAALLPSGLRVGVYDGDTPPSARAAVRKSASIVLTNPDMLHVGILPNNAWSGFFRSLRYVVVDEAHVYRGLFGAHCAGVFRRLLRLCAGQRARPRIVAATATVANPGEAFEALFGRTATVIDEDGSPQGGRSLVFVAPMDADDPGAGLTTTAALLTAELVSAGSPTLTFCGSRTATELVARRTNEALGRAGAVDSYRGGYTREERRAIERRFFSGELRGLVSTSAMELGVDVGHIESVVMVGYPGAVSRFWQQAGRAGRGGRPGLAVLLAREDPLEAFLTRDPEQIVGRAVERVAVPTRNPTVCRAQLACAAYEAPISEDEVAEFGPGYIAALAEAAGLGELAPAGGRWIYPSHTSPAVQVSIRGLPGGDVTLAADGEVIGTMEYWRARRYAHEGAVYLHRGDTFLVRSLDLARGLAVLDRADPPWFTRPVAQSVFEPQFEVEADAGLRLVATRVTTAVTGYMKLDPRTMAVLDRLELEPDYETMDTVAVQLALEADPIEDAAAVHAVQHAMVTTAPLVAACDRQDLLSAWYALDPATMAPTIYVADAAPGGSGLAEALFAGREDWRRQALALFEGCPCEDGCPSCALVSWCEVSNEALDKRGAIRLMGAGA